MSVLTFDTKENMKCDPFEDILSWRDTPLLHLMNPFDTDSEKISPQSQKKDVPRVSAILKQATDLMDEWKEEITDGRLPLPYEPTPIGPNGIQCIIPPVCPSRTAQFPVTITSSTNNECHDGVTMDPFPTHLMNETSFWPVPLFKNDNVCHFPPSLQPSINQSEAVACTSAATMPTASIGSDNAAEPRFRRDQSSRWEERYKELIEFKARYGHCLVPNKFPLQQPLAQWVKRQRYQYKLKRTGSHTTLSDEREALLDKLGFVWASHEVSWYERLEMLKEFRLKHGHCRVPANYSDQSLAVWVKCQRRAMSLYRVGMRANLDRERIRLLNSLGFEWNLRKRSSPRAKSKK